MFSGVAPSGAKEKAFDATSIISFETAVA